MENSTTWALGGEARCGTKVAKKWWETVARLALERLQPGLGNSGCATVRRGAFRRCPGAFRGAFGASKVDLWSSLSVRCFPKFIHWQRKERLQHGLGIHSDLGIPRLKWYRRSAFLVDE